MLLVAPPPHASRVAPLHHVSRSRPVVCLRTVEELRALTTADIRSTPPLELEVLLEEIEAEAQTQLEATGSADVQYSQLLAVAHTCTGDHEVAEPHARAALDVGSPDADMYFVLGIAAERRDAQDEALDHYESAVNVDPKCWRALFHTGKIALSFGWPADAVDYFRQVAEINPSHAPTQAFLARLEEAGIDVQAWQDGDLEKNEDGDDDLPPQAPLDVPDEMGDFKL